MWLIVLKLFVVTCTLTLGQRITLEKPRFQSACDSSLIGNVDRFRIKGMIAGNVATYLASGWEETINIAVSSTLSDEWNLCEIPLTTASCKPDLTTQCYCSEVSSNTGEVSFVIDHIAGVALSDNTIRAKWKYNASVSVYSNNHTLPQMFDDSAAELVLAVHGTTEESLAESTTCSYSLTLNNSIRLTVCCNSPLTPCYPRITFNEEDAVTNKSCVSYPTSELPSGEVTGEVVLTYTVCNSTREIAADTCSFVSKTSTTRATTRSVTTTMSKRTTLIRTTVTRTTLTTTTVTSRPSTAKTSSTTLGSSRETGEPRLAAVVAPTGSQDGGENFLFYLLPGILIAAVGFSFFSVYGFFPDAYRTNCKRARAESGGKRGSAGTRPAVEEDVEQAADFDIDAGTEV